MKQFESFKGTKRKLQIEAGAYDGRFRNKVVADKKKKENKTRCRIKLVYQEN
jgi:hypothetical protein